MRSQICLIATALLALLALQRAEAAFHVGRSASYSHKWHYEPEPEPEPEPERCDYEEEAETCQRPVVVPTAAPETCYRPAAPVAPAAPAHVTHHYYLTLPEPETCEEPEAKPQYVSQPPRPSVHFEQPQQHHHHHHHHQQPAPGTPPPCVPAPETPAPCTPAPCTPAPPTQAPCTPAPCTPAPCTPAPPTQAPCTPAPPTQAPCTPAPCTPAPCTPAPPTQAPCTPAPPTQAPCNPVAPPTQAPCNPVAPPTQAPSTPETIIYICEDPEPEVPEPVHVCYVQSTTTAAPTCSRQVDVFEYKNNKQCCHLKDNTKLYDPDNNCRYYICFCGRTISRHCPFGQVFDKDTGCCRSRS